MINLCNVLIIFIIAILILLICKNLNLSYDNFISGYGLSNILPTNTNISTSSIIPNNLITKSTDFKLLSLLNQLKYRIIQPEPNLIKTYTDKGIISTGIKSYANIIIFPGNGDYKLNQNNTQIWPNISNTKIDTNTYITVDENKSGHLNPIYTLLEDSLNYKEGINLNTVVYNFIKFDINAILSQFKTFINKNTIIIAYDFGCIIANIIINLLNKFEKSKIVKLLYICPTIGGVPISLKDFFENVNVRNFQSLHMSFPIKQFFNNAIVIYNSIGYKAQNINNLLANIQIKKLFDSDDQFINLSIKNPEIPCIIVSNNEYNTPVSYNYKNNLLKSPEAYLSENNNFSPSLVIEPVNIGIQTKGDQIVPYSNITKLKELWGENVVIQLIKNKNHFSILKSYELALIISSII